MPGVMRLVTLVRCKYGEMLVFVDNWNVLRCRFIKRHIFDRGEQSNILRQATQPSYVAETPIEDYDLRFCDDFVEDEEFKVEMDQDSEETSPIK